MTMFPRTTIDSLSVSRLIIGSNWFLGFSHQTTARDSFIKTHMSAERIAAVLEVFLAAGVDTLMGVRPGAPQLSGAIAQAQERTGRRCIMIGTPGFNLAGTPAADDENQRMLDEYAAIGTRILMPHQSTTDALVNRRTRTLERIEPLLTMIRDRGMIPGLSTHMNETPGYADAAGLDVATYIQIYNAIGFLMQTEVEWVHHVIWRAAKPVMTIKPLAAGRLTPLVGLAFAWATLRPIDMVTIGTFTPDEAREVIETSLSLLERRAPEVALQTTRSKESLRAPGANV